MARKKIVLDPWRPQIEQWLSEGLRKEEIQRRLQEQADINIGLSTLGTQLRVWGIRSNRSPIKKTEELRDRVKELFHTRPTMKDEEMVMLLQHEGFQISGTRALARLRKDNGLMKRVKKEQEEKIKKEVIEALRQEFGDEFELPDDLATRDLSVYLRSKYNLVGRDRIRRIAAEIKPEWIQRRKQKGQFPRSAPVSDTMDADAAVAVSQGSPAESTPHEASTNLDDQPFADIPRLPELSHAHDVPVPDTASQTTLRSSRSFTNGFGLAPAWLDPSLLDTG